MDSLVVWRHDFDERLLSQPGFGRFQDFEHRKGSKMVELTTVAKHCFDSVPENNSSLPSNLADKHFGPNPFSFRTAARHPLAPTETNRIFLRKRGYSKTGSAAPITHLETIGVSHTKGAIYAKFCRRYLDDGSQLYAQCHQKHSQCFEIMLKALGDSDFLQKSEENRILSVKTKTKPHNFEKNYLKHPQTTTLYH